MKRNQQSLEQTLGGQTVNGALPVAPPKLNPEHHSPTCLPDNGIIDPIQNEIDTWNKNRGLTKVHPAETIKQQDQDANDI